MQPLDPSSPDELAARVADHPLFRDFATLLNISTATGPVEETSSSLAKRVRWHRPPAVVRFTIVEGAHRRSWSLHLSRQSCTTGETRGEPPDLEVMTTDDVWLKVVRGELAPLDAFGRGQMRVLGSIEVARSLARGLCES